MDRDLPAGFVRLREVAPSIFQDVRYCGSNNFLGRPVAGYQAPDCLMTNEGAAALVAVDTYFRGRGLALKLFDTYRPAQAVADFLAWAMEPDDPVLKAAYYPRLEKAELFSLGYVARRSSHSRGSTVDLTVVALDQGPEAELDFGTPFDLFDPLSHTRNPEISAPARDNRDMLVAAMDAHGFDNLPQEWWHFTLRDEPFPDTYFDFPIRWPGRTI